MATGLTATAPGISISGPTGPSPILRPWTSGKCRLRPLDGASAPRTQVRYSNGNREYPEFIGSAQFATGPGDGSHINFAVRGRYGDPHRSFIATTPMNDPARCTELKPGRNPHRQRVGLRRLALCSRPPQPCYSGPLPEAARSRQGEKVALAESMRNTRCW